MRRTEMMQEIRRMRFAEVYSRWTERCLTQEQAAEILGVSDRTFRRYQARYEEEGLEGLQDKRLTQASSRRAAVDEVLEVARQYERYRGWSVRHFYGRYLEVGGKRSYTWVKSSLQTQGKVSKAEKRGVHRQRRDRVPLPGMMLHQDGSSHEWVPGKRWDLIVTMDETRRTSITRCSSIGGSIDDILCEHAERTVNADNCVSFERLTLQVPANRYRCHYIRVKVQVHRYLDGSLAIFHGPRKLADCDSRGKLKNESEAA